MPQEKYAQAQAERAKHGEAILASPATKKLVVAGPGTGKTHLFKQILHNKNKTLTLSFVNALVADLALELCGLSEVRTLHGYARTVLAETLKKSVKIHPALSGIVQADAKIRLEQDIDFAAIFHQRDDHTPQHQRAHLHPQRARHRRHHGRPRPYGPYRPLRPLRSAVGHLHLHEQLPHSRPDDRVMTHHNSPQIQHPRPGEECRT